jgi:hypothetical protein
LILLDGTHHKFCRYYHDNRAPWLSRHVPLVHLLLPTLDSHQCHLKQWKNVTYLMKRFWCSGSQYKW